MMMNILMILAISAVLMLNVLIVILAYIAVGLKFKSVKEIVLEKASLKNRNEKEKIIAEERNNVGGINFE